MNLQLSYARGAANTISVADKQNIYLGNITLNHFGMIGFEQKRALSIVEKHEIQMVCQRLQEVVR
jgi:hypothetical protein